MRRSFGKISYPVMGRASTSASIPAAFSASSGGRGRGGATPFKFTVESSATPESSNAEDESPPPLGHGRGRGKSFPSSPILPSFSSFINNDAVPPATGRGRGFIPPKSTSPQPELQDSKLIQQPLPPKSGDRKPFLFVDDATENSANSETPLKQENILPSDIINVLTGAGRGKPIKPVAASAENAKAENRHVRQRQPAKPSVAADDGGSAVDKRSSTKEQLTQDEKVKKAVQILSKKDDVDGRRGGGGIRSGRGGRGGQGRGRGMFVGRGRGGGRGRGRGRGREEDRYEDSENDEPEGLYLGDPADGEKLAEKLGPEVVNELVEGFEEMSSRVLPSPADEAYLDALHTNLLIECEPEYMMEEFGTNPDIDEKPPIPLRDAFEKMKPFLMAYEGIQSQEEWEEIIEETMKNVPLIKEVVDYYSGPDRVTAKQQQEELDRVAKTLPASAPASVKRFTERAVLSLQSNPGWGFDKKCQFMDKIVMEVSQQYK